MSRLYYDCPLKAAYMSKEFKVIYLRGDQSLIGWNSFNMTAPEKCDPPFFLDEISEKIFKPKEHDVVEFDGIIFGLVNGVDKDKTFVQCDDVFYQIDTEDCTIIQRDDKPFFTPKELKDENDIEQPEV